MSNQIKATKTPKNQPEQFRESLAAAQPGHAGLAAPSMPKVSMRVLLWVVWALATIALGVGVGRLIRDLNTADTTEPGIPVAQADIQQPVAATQRTIAQPAPASQPDLAVKSGAQGVNQAQAGSPSAVLATAVFQPATDPDSLQPGFQTEVRVQGQIGTQPTR